MQVHTTVLEATLWKSAFAKANLVVDLISALNRCTALWILGSNVIYFIFYIILSCVVCASAVARCMVVWCMACTRARVCVHVCVCVAS